MKYLMTVLALMFVAYKLYLRFTANDEVDEGFSVLDQFNLNDFRPEVSE